MGLLSWFVVGLLAGLLARVVVRPGKSFGCIGTGLVGMGGSLVGGALGNLVVGEGVKFHRTGLVGSVIGAVVLLAVVRLFTRR